MKSQKIYAKENFKINEYKINIYDEHLKKVYNDAIDNDCMGLAKPISTLLIKNNKFAVKDTKHRPHFMC